MTTGFVILLVVHGLIHLVGFTKAFGLAELAIRPISPALGALWLVAAVLFLGAAVSLLLWPRIWWIVGVCALVASVLSILPSWSDAKFALVVNGLIAIGVAFGFLSQGPFSLRAKYERDREAILSAPASRGAITDADLTHLPPTVQRYLRLAGVVGRPRVDSFRARMHGRIRSEPGARWMALAAEQYNVLRPAARLFYLKASMFGVPVQGYHRYVGSDASMMVKAAGLVPVAAAEGATMTQSETVTLFNDMCIVAPATLVDRAIAWEAIDAYTVGASFTNAARTIHAELRFAESGELVNFFSEDRYQASADGTTLTRVRWSTPVRHYRSFGGTRLASSGEGWWHGPDGEYAYIELTIDDVEYNVSAP